MLAVCYGNKDYAKRNVKKAFKTLNKVTGSPIADYYLSSMLETGTSHFSKGLNSNADRGCGEYYADKQRFVKVGTSKG